MAARRARSVHVSPCAILGLALPLLLVLGGVLPGPPSLGEEPQARAASEREDAPQAQRDRLRGLWTRYDHHAGEGEPLRFWYFHGDGKGLYRYGRVGMTNTHSFDYEVEGSDARVGLGLRFRKTGEAHAISAMLERDESGQTWMTLRGDPREPGARYRRVDSDLDFTELAARMQAQAEPPAGDAVSAAGAIGDRMWIDYSNYATGGAGFHMYQFGRTSLDGRGVGWFHRGDFDEWSTESLTYRVSGERIELFFDLREEPASSVFHVLDGDDSRALRLESDPRDFWAPHRYADGGKSFDSAAFELLLGLELYLSADAAAPRARRGAPGRGRASM